SILNILSQCPKSVAHRNRNGVALLVLFGVRLAWRLWINIFVASAEERVAAADAVFYVRKGKIKLVVTSKQGNGRRQSHRTRNTAVSFEVISDVTDDALLPLLTGSNRSANADQIFQCCDR